MRHGWRTLPEFEAVLKEITDQNDRGAAITAGAAVEHALQLAIEARWPPMSNTQRENVFGDRAPLGTLSAKIEIARAMGLIDQKTTVYLNAIRLIRNEFAHDMKPLSFLSERVMNHCNNLPDFVSLGGSVKLAISADPHTRMRNRFIHKANDLLMVLLNGPEIDEP